MPIKPYGPEALARLRSVQARPQGWTHATRDQVREHKDPTTGELIKVITDQLGNKIRMRKHGQDVRIELPVLRIRTRAEEIR